GKACFLCETEVSFRDVGDTIYCSECGVDPMIPFDLSKPQNIIAHVGAHIECGGIQKSLLPCGLCLSPAPHCEFFLTKGANTQIDRKRSRGCVVFKSLSTRGFKYAVAAQSTAKSPCSNVPIECRICSRDPTAPAIWKYTAREHYKTVHPNADLNLYKADWEISTSEKKAMRKVYKERKKLSKPKKSRGEAKALKEIGALVVSEAHSTRTSHR
ncbi:hypothetical protein BDZ89DRAFT_943749, partial [Hymenopellis radicata]